MADKRQARVEKVATSARQLLQCRGVYVIVDWGDGEHGSWLNAANESPLNELADAVEAAIRNSGDCIGAERTPS